MLKQAVDQWVHHTYTKGDAILSATDATTFLLRNIFPRIHKIIFFSCWLRERVSVCFGALGAVKSTFAGFYRGTGLVGSLANIQR